MRVLKKDLAHGLVKLLAENPDDLWHLRHLVEPGDIVHAVTYRREERATDMVRPEKSERRRMYLGVEVENVEFHDFSDRLRIHGLIRDGPDDVNMGAHHTLNIEVGDDVKVQKQRWRGYELDRIQEAVRATRRPSVIIVAIDDEVAVFTAVRQSGVETLSEIRGPGTLKGQDRPAKGAMEDYFAELLEELLRVRGDGAPVIVVGPGFKRTDFIEYVREKAPEGADALVTEGTGQSGMVGVQEAIKRGMVSRVVEGARVEFETHLIESLMASIGKGDGMSTYGLEHVRRAVEAGAAERVLVSDDVVREGPITSLLEAAEGLGSTVTVISTVHEAGERLSRMGGIAALLRYPFRPDQ
jgi:protein pelota